MGLGSDKTAWSWLPAPVRPGRRERLGQSVQIDEAFVVATETDGRVRLAHAGNNLQVALKLFAEKHVVPQAAVTTDGLASYNRRSVGDRPREASGQTSPERQQQDTLQGADWVVSLLKRWLLGAHPGEIRCKHLRAYLARSIHHNQLDRHRVTTGVSRRPG